MNKTAIFISVITVILVFVISIIFASVDKVSVNRTSPKSRPALTRSGSYKLVDGITYDYTMHYKIKTFPAPYDQVNGLNK